MIHPELLASISPRLDVLHLLFIKLRRSEASCFIYLILKDPNIDGKIKRHLLPIQNSHSLQSGEGLLQTTVEDSNALLALSLLPLIKAVDVMMLQCAISSKIGNGRLEQLDSLLDVLLVILAVANTKQVADLRNASELGTCFRARTPYEGNDRAYMYSISSYSLGVEV